jgi:hypothetical protein
MYIIIAIALALSLGVGATAVAEHSQPGDALYSVKTNVNDRIEAAVEPVTTEFRALFNAEADANAEAEINAAGGTYLTGHEGGEDSDKMDTDFGATVETDANVNLSL